METKKRAGRVSKDSEITNGFNQTKIYESDAAVERRLLLEKRRLYRQAYRKAAKEKAGVKEEVPAEDADDNARDADDLKSAYQMLQDMRWVYRNVKGREKLKELVKGDDKQFVFMVKELMKIEASLMAAQIRKEGPTNQSGNQSFFVILKGLETDKAIIEMASGTSELNIKQIQSAMNPDGSEYVDRGE